MDVMGKEMGDGGCVSGGLFFGRYMHMNMYMYILYIYIYMGCIQLQHNGFVWLVILYFLRW